MEIPDGSVDDLLVGRGLRREQPAFWIDSEREVAVATHRLGLSVGWVDASWPHPGIPVTVLRDICHVPYSDRQAAQLDQGLESAHRSRAAATRKCIYCQIAYTPGHMHDNDVCHGCAEKHLGVVH